jgi:hypothetical protein
MRKQGPWYSDVEVEVARALYATHKTWKAAAPHMPGELARRGVEPLRSHYVGTNMCKAVARATAKTAASAPVVDAELAQRMLAAQDALGEGGISLRAELAAEGHLAFGPRLDKNDDCCVCGKTSDAPGPMLLDGHVHRRKTCKKCAAGLVKAARGRVRAQQQPEESEVRQESWVPYVHTASAFDVPHHAEPEGSGGDRAVGDVTLAKRRRKREHSRRSQMSLDGRWLVAMAPRRADVPLALAPQEQWEASLGWLDARARDSLRHGGTAVPFRQLRPEEPDGLHVVEISAFRGILDLVEHGSAIGTAPALWRKRVELACAQRAELMGPPGTRFNFVCGDRTVRCETVAPMGHDWTWAWEGGKLNELSLQVRALALPCGEN